MRFWMNLLHPLRQLNRALKSNVANLAVTCAKISVKHIYFGVGYRKRGRKALNFKGFLPLPLKWLPNSEGLRRHARSI
jgi:hypothetical protein